ncbi:MAG TPA: glycosyltransferase family 2 protein [Steroidobacteraceae bacterium]
MRLSLVVTTYERPDALAATLRTIAQQTERPDELIVADDGSGPSTREVIQQHMHESGLAVVHVWQEHQGFRLTRLRNAAIARATGDFIVFVDGDMLLHPAFVADHRRFARRGTFTQGMRIPLDEALTAKLITARGTLPDSGTDRRRRWYGTHSPTRSRLLRKLANTFVSIKGCNQGFWRDDLIAVNGFNEAMIGWGPEDKEIAARLAHYGIRRHTLVFGGIAWHLHHPPASREREAANIAILNQTLARRLVRCEQGLDAHLKP